MNSEFDFNRAFCRTLGWLTVEEQEVLKKKKIAIGGLGGVGGHHLLTLTRLGFQNFHLADFDQFCIENFNRQAGAKMSTVGKEKLDVMVAEASDINPLLQIKTFPEGITSENLGEFLNGVDLYVDGLDAFSLEIRAEVFAGCAKRSIPAITSVPAGFGTGFTSFLPGGISFENYFGFKGRSNEERFMRIILGLTPHFLHMPALVDRSYINIAEKKLSSVGVGCMIAAGIVGAECIKILLKRGSVVSAPMAAQFDAYSGRFRKSWMPWGHRNPIFRLKLFIIRFIFMKKKRLSQAHQS